MKIFFIFLLALFLSCSSSASAYACFSDDHSRPSVFREVFRGSFELPEEFSFDFSPILGEDREVFRAILRFVVINPERTPGEFSLLADGMKIFSVVDLHRKRQSFRLDLFGLAPESLADGRLALDFSGPEDVYLRRVVLNARARPSSGKGGSEVPIPGAVWLFGSGLAMLAPAKRFFIKK